MLVFSVNVSISYGRVPPLTAIGDRVLFFLSDNCLFTGIVGSPTLQKYGTEKGDHDGAGKYKDSTSTKSEQLSCQLRMGIDGAVLSLDIRIDSLRIHKLSGQPLMLFCLFAFSTCGKVQPYLIFSGLSSEPIVVRPKLAAAHDLGTALFRSKSCFNQARQIRLTNGTIRGHHRVRRKQVTTHPTACLYPSIPAKSIKG